MTRKRYKWDINCERYEKDGRHEFLKEMSNIRAYFLPLDQIMALVDRGKDHDHPSQESESLDY